MSPLSLRCTHPFCARAALNSSGACQPRKAVKAKAAARPAKFSATDQQQLAKLRSHYEAVDRVKLEVLAESSEDEEQVEIASLDDGWQDDSKRIRSRFRHQMQAEISKIRSGSEPQSSEVRER